MAWKRRLFSLRICSFLMCRTLVKPVYHFLWLSIRIIHQNIPCLSGQPAIQSHLLLHQKLHLSFLIFKEREESGFVEHTRVRFRTTFIFISLSKYHVFVKFGLSSNTDSTKLFSFPGYGFHEDGLKVYIDSVVIHCCITYSNLWVQVNSVMY